MNIQMTIHIVISDYLCVNNAFYCLVKFMYYKVLLLLKHGYFQPVTIRLTGDAGDNLFLLMAAFLARKV